MPIATARLHLRVSPTGHAVGRVAACFAARRLEIVELHWRAGDGEASASLTVAGDPARVARAPLWLERLVDVLEVSRRDRCPWLPCGYRLRAAAGALSRFSQAQRRAWQGKETTRLWAGRS